MDDMLSLTLMKQFQKDSPSCFSVSFAFVGDEFFR